MKNFLLCLLLMVAFGTTEAQQKPKTPSKIPPEYQKQIEKMLPPGVKLPPGYNLSEEFETNPEKGGGNAAMNNLPPVTMPAFNPAPGGKVGNYPYSSGRNESQRAAALFAVNAELNTKPFLLPMPETAPTVGYMLQMAKVQHTLAVKKFSTQDHLDYTGLVDWKPEFDTNNLMVSQARDYSVIVAMATNFSNRPHLLIALAAAVFSLDPYSSVAANNFGSAFVTAGEHLVKPPVPKTALAPYRKDAESAFLYAIYASRNGESWTERSVIPAINLGNLCIDLKKYEEARSLFMIARRLKPSSWDAALGLAAYYHAIMQPNKALAILEDDKLDRPALFMMAIKSAKSLQKTDKYVGIPVDAPDSLYQKGIDIIAQEPILTSADFLENFDQSERNKMRYFIEHLPDAGTFKAPSISLIAQFSSVQAISSVSGMSALEEFEENIARFRIQSVTANVKNQAALLERLGLKIEGIDLDDLQNHPEKYMDGKRTDKIRITGKEQLQANLEKYKKQALAAQKDLAAGKIASTMVLAGNIDPYFKLLQINPEDYADPINIIMQKHNFTVYNRKTNLYNGYLYSVNRKTTRLITEKLMLTHKKFAELAKRESDALAQYILDKSRAMKQGEDTETAEWKLRLHRIHVNYFNEKNNLSETVFNDLTSLASSTYVQKIKPTAEAYYYDVIRHIAMISDPEVRDEKDMFLNTNINTNISIALSNVFAAYWSFKYHDEWDCDCDIEALMAQREQEQLLIEAEQAKQREKNLAGKKAFFEKNLKGTELFKKLDSYYDEYDFILFKVRASCARTVIILDTRKFPIPPSKAGHLNATLSWNEFNNDIRVNGGIGAEVGKGPVKANLDLKGDLVLDGNLSVKDWSITPEARVEATVGNITASAGGQATFDKTGLKDYNVGADIKTSVKYGNTEVSGGASVSYNSKGELTTDFSAKGEYSLKNELGGEGKVTMDASSLRGCSLTAEVEQSLQPVENFIKETGLEDHAKNAGVKLPLDSITKKGLWSGRFGSKEKKTTETE